MSGEENQDSEPTIAVNPANPLQMAASAFTPDPSGGALAPIFVSADGGRSWSLNSIVPSDSMTGDITVAFGTTSNALYAGILRFPAPLRETRLNILRTRSFQSASPMEVLVDRLGVDQPYVQATTVATGAARGKDRLYVGNNDLAARPGSATIDQSLSSASPSPSFKSVRIEPRNTGTAGQDGPAVRPVVHRDGTVYAAYYAWRSFNAANKVAADVVVVRDDAGGGGTKPFTSLTDPVDGRSGMRVVRGVSFTWDRHLGQQRIGGDLAIAVDPANSANVWLAYAGDSGQNYNLHVVRSTDKGQTWSNDLRAKTNALNPGLAVNKSGVVGFLYQQLAGAGARQRWTTSLDLKTPSGGWRTVKLATSDASVPAALFDPYIGDYVHLMSVAMDFYGIFSASNEPRNSNFPNGVTYQRNADFAKARLLDVDGVTPVGVSIDPFFLKVTP